MPDKATVEYAEQLSRRRARMLPFLAIIYLTQQATFFSADAPSELRSVDHVKIGAWLVLSLVLLLAIATNGFWFHSFAWARRRARPVRLSGAPRASE